jgi:hypothetical protein
MLDCVEVFRLQSCEEIVRAQRAGEVEDYAGDVVHGIMVSCGMKGILFVWHN